MSAGFEQPLIKKLGFFSPDLVKGMGAREEPLRFESGQVLERVSGGRWKRWKRKVGS